MTCTVCGHHNLFDAKFCSQCAAQLSSHATPVDPSTARGAAFYAPSFMPPKSTNAVAVLVLGILSICVCGVLGPIAWIMGRKELDQMTAGTLSREGHGMAQAGYICGIIGTGLFALTLIWVLFVFSRFPF
jgi:hypothetical protein